MAAKDRMKVCSCGHPNPPENISCENCFTDLTGKYGTSTSTGQLVHMGQLTRLAEDTNYRIRRLTLHMWLIIAVIVGWRVVATVMEVGGPNILLSWLLP